MTRRLTLAAAALLAVSIVFIAAWTTRTTQVAWTGTISDSQCKINHGPEAGSLAKEHDCTLACVKTGQKYVFVSASTHKAYTVSNQEFGDLPKFAGHSVSLTGVAGWSSLKISTLSAVN